MKAYVLHGIGDLGLEEVEKPKAGEGEVIVQVKAAGICGSDIPRIYGTGAYFYPLIPGHEFSGKVVELGANADPFWLNRRVGIFPLLPCRKCGPCQKKQYELCRSYSYLGSRTSGGFAEYVKVPVWNLLELPENISYEQAAMLEPMSVAVHAIRRAKITKESVVAIAGLGAIGLFVLMFLQEMGLRNIIVIGNKAFQEKKARELGIDAMRFCNVRERQADSWIKEITEGNGADVFFECVGKNEVLELAIKHTAPNGQVILVGNPASDMTLERHTYWRLLRSQLSVIGTWNTSFTHERDDDWHYCLERLTSRRIKPEILISHRLPFEKLIDGTELMKERKEEYGKVMIQI